MFKQRHRRLRDRGNYAMNLAGMLKPGVTRAAAEQALDTLGQAARRGVHRSPITIRRSCWPACRGWA